MTAPDDIQRHLYTSFLQRRTADATLRIAAWNVLYRVHKVVLIQAGFFRGLFDGGFVEEGGDAVDLVFVDRNISRAAFELCLARLYGGGPPLHFNPESPVPEGHQVADPGFLLSLLATALYLSIPHIASQALAAVLSSVGPYTLIQYLDFALGLPIRADSGPPAVGLESVAEEYEDEDDRLSSTKFDTAHSIASHAPSTASTASLDSYAAGTDPGANERHTYGAISDKIGEACAAWLARWGVDVFSLEHDSSFLTTRKRERAKSAPSGTVPELDHTPTVPGVNPDRPLHIWSRLSPSWIRALISSDTFFIRDETRRFYFARDVVEYRRSLLQSHTDEEEEEWALLFEKGIYYTNMPMQDLIEISSLVSPTTGTPYVPLHVLQSAYWSQGVLRNLSTTVVEPSSKELRITTQNIHAPENPRAAGDRYWRVYGDSSFRVGDINLNLDSKSAHTTSMEDLFNVCASHMPSTDHGSKRFFGLVDPESPVDVTKGKGRAVEQIPPDAPKYTPYPPMRFSVEFYDVHLLSEKTRLYSRTVWYAGSLFNIYVQVNNTSTNTTTRRKPAPGATQLGIYVHRQSSVDPAPGASAPRPLRHAQSLTFAAIVKPAPPPPPPPIEATPPRPSSAHARHTRNLSGGAASSVGSPTRSFMPMLSRSVTPGARTSAAAANSPPPAATPLSSSLPSSTSMPERGVLAHYETRPLGPDEPERPAPSAGPYMAPPQAAPNQAYRDPRAAVLAYFGVTCHVSGATRGEEGKDGAKGKGEKVQGELGGAGQVRFSSAPDVFKVSQSWGWKSRDLNVVGEGAARTLRASVVLGLV
ncbi:hypothetical protein K523DRAFT_262317 [Schizophyllum commune Tattone D]|nr:hypothetical protein K523DRAFT_262317 [Schizophyllum commune Tattone D]